MLCKWYRRIVASGRGKGGRGVGLSRLRPSSGSRPLPPPPFPSSPSFPLLFWPSYSSMAGSTFTFLPSGCHPGVIGTVGTWGLPCFILGGLLYRKIPVKPGLRMDIVALPRCCICRPAAVGHVGM